MRIAPLAEVKAQLAWYPRLLHGQPEERNNWRLIGQGEGVHWPDLDEDISAETAFCADRNPQGVHQEVHQIL